MSTLRIEYVTHLHQNYFPRRSYDLGTTSDLFEQIKKSLTEDQEEIFMLSPYGQDGPQLVLSHHTTRKMLERGFVDKWKRHWKLTHFDAGTKPYVLKFRVKRSVIGRLKRSVHRLIHPLIY